MESSKAEPEQEAVEIRTEMEGGKKKTQNENAGCEDSIADDREHEQNATGEETREKTAVMRRRGVNAPEPWINPGYQQSTCIMMHWYLMGILILLI